MVHNNIQLRKPLIYLKAPRNGQDRSYTGPRFQATTIAKNKHLIL